MPSDTHNNLQIHIRVFIAMNKLYLDRYPSDRYPSLLLRGVGEFLFVYFGKPFMNVHVYSGTVYTVRQRLHALRTEKMAQEINSIVARYLSWIAQLVRALVWKAKGPCSSTSPGQNFSLSVLKLGNRWP